MKKEIFVKQPALKTPFMFKGTVKGKPAWSNGYLMEIGEENPLPRCKIDWKQKANFEEAVERNSPEEVIYKKVEKASELKEEVVKLFSRDILNIAYINKDYYFYFMQKYPDCKVMISNDKLSAIQFISESELVGLCMPVLGVVEGKEE